MKKMGIRIFEHAQNLNLKFDNQSKDLSERDIKENARKWSMLRYAINTKKINIKDNIHRNYLIKYLNKIRYWTANNIMLNKRILAYILFGNKENVRNFMRDAFALGLYLPKVQLIKILNKHYDALKAIYQRNPEELDILEILTKNFFEDPFNNVVEKQVLERDEINVIRLIPEEMKTKKDTVKLTDDMIKSYMENVQKIKTNKRPTFITYPGTTIKKILNSQIFDLREKTTKIVINAYYSSKHKFIETIKDNIITIAFNWNFSDENLKFNKVPADIIYNMNLIPPPENANYERYGNWYIYNGIKWFKRSNKFYLSENTIVNENLRFDNEKNTLIIPYYWMINDTLCFACVVPDIRIDRNIAKIIHKIKFARKFDVSRFEIKK